MIRTVHSKTSSSLASRVPLTHSVALFTNDAVAEISARPSSVDALGPAITFTVSSSVSKGRRVSETVFFRNFSLGIAVGHQRLSRESKRKIAHKQRIAQ
jgi:hypothetical protein